MKDWITAATSGYGSTAETSGNWSTAATSGERSTAATSGNWSTAATSGDKSIAISNGQNSVAVAWGYETKACGALGCYLVLSEFDDYGNLICARMHKVDGKTIKPDTLYTLRGGKFVKAVD